MYVYIFILILETIKNFIYAKRNEFLQLKKSGYSSTIILAKFDLLVLDWNFIYKFSKPESKNHISIQKNKKYLNLKKKTIWLDL